MKRWEKKLGNQANFSPFMQLNSSDFKLSQCESS